MSLEYITIPNYQKHKKQLFIYAHPNLTYIGLRLIQFQRTAMRTACWGADWLAFLMKLRFILYRATRSRAKYLFIKNGQGSKQIGYCYCCFVRLLRKCKSIIQHRCYAWVHTSIWGRMPLLGSFLLYSRLQRGADVLQSLAPYQGMSTECPVRPLMCETSILSSKRYLWFSAHIHQSIRPHCVIDHFVCGKVHYSAALKTSNRDSTAL